MNVGHPNTGQAPRSIRSCSVALTSLVRTPADAAMLRPQRKPHGVLLAMAPYRRAHGAHRNGTEISQQQPLKFDANRKDLMAAPTGIKVCTPASRSVVVSKEKLLARVVQSTSRRRRTAATAISPVARAIPKQARNQAVGAWSHQRTPNVPFR